MEIQTPSLSLGAKFLTPPPKKVGAWSSGPGPLPGAHCEGGGGGAGQEILSRSELPAPHQAQGGRPKKQPEGQKGDECKKTKSRDRPEVQEGEAEIRGASVQVYILLKPAAHVPGKSLRGLELLRELLGGNPLIPCLILRKPGFPFQRS